MSLILGMDPLVFTAWLLTILSAIFCVVYGLYYEYLKKPSKKTVPKEIKKPEEKEAE